ncbi:GNAT family N-acetyltransferase [Phaeobacter porticola]|uniref:Acetyltransferase and methytransferase domain-containing protein n=1 Tax=Phaeobacter porticola TaxID=1844006 RepID=A0A1L3I2D0_9RHOB|nr:GNAT family N-acetyltransferase [Phaeobacter porticola]APG46265.1 acetyltransferase and methytransferase domain-containing protein [Phaeobacter porticola]
MSLLSLRSDRLVAIRPEEIATGDLAALFAPEVVRWLPPGFQTCEGEADQRAFLRKLQHQAEVIGLADARGEVLGLMVLTDAAPGEDTRHLGYLLAERVWGQGLASELLAALQVQMRGRAVTLAGGVMMQNHGSARVLVKAGFVPDHAEASAAAEGEVIYRWRAT